MVGPCCSDVPHSPDEADPAAVQSVAEGLEAFLCANPHSSLVELEQHVPGFAGNDCSWCFDGNVIVWPHLSAAGFAAIRQLRQAGRIDVDPCSPLIYLMDGCVPRFPVVKRPPPAGGFKRERWLPVTLSIK
jgi:hypothetical protein